MRQVKVKLNSAGVRELLLCEELKMFLEETGRTIAIRAGSGYNVQTHRTETRHITNVFAEDNAARRDNLKNNTLLRAMQ